MRRRAFIATLLVLLAAPASASAEGVLDVYTELANRNFKRAPLVFTTVPKPLRPLERYLHFTGVPRGYGLRLSNDTDAVVAVAGGVYRTMGAADRWYTRSGFKKSPTRVRGHRGFLYKRARNISLVWSEGGVVYEIGSGTPRKISAAALRQTANALEPVGIARYGSTPYSDAANASVFAVTTEKTITAHVTYDADCQYGGFMDVVFHPRQGNTFSFPITGDWSGTVSGTIGPTSISVNLRATRTTPEGKPCDTGPMSFTLDQVED